MREFVVKSFALVGIEIEWSGKEEAEIGTDKATGTVRVRVDPKVTCNRVASLYLSLSCFCTALCRVPALPCPALPCPALPCPALPCLAWY